ncbi:MAG: putative inorganic carbon transporter subunit DabA, partial [Methylococcaceae bacterium]
MLNSTNPNSHTPTFDLDDSLERIAHWLPTQRPIKDFVHHNTLHALEEHDFHVAIAIAARLFGAYSYLPISDYQARYYEGRITNFALNRAIDENACGPREELALRSSLFDRSEGLHYPPVSLANQGIRAHWLTAIEVNLNALVQPVLFRLMANFLDQGLARWSVARAGESLWACARRLVENSFVPLYPLGDPQGRELLQQTPDAAIHAALHQIVGDPSLYEQYLLEMVLTHPGWSGMVSVIEADPSALLSRRLVSLKEFVAVELTLEATFLAQKRGQGYQPVHAIPTLSQAARLK